MNGKWQLLATTRELAKYKGLRVSVFYGGTPVAGNIEFLAKYTHNIVVGTPGRIKDLINRSALDLSNVSYFVLDEADLMLDMGFIEDVEEIISHIPTQRQSFMFSATIPRQVEGLARKYLREDYKLVRVINAELKPKIEERLIRLSSPAQKLSELEKLLRGHLFEKVIIFVKTRKDAKELAERLKAKNFKVVALHGDMTQRQRENALRLFKDGKVRIVVATNVVSRGLDIKGVGVVINYHIPEDPEVYIHRIGRTGRIGNYGKAYSFATPEDSRALWRIKNLGNPKKLRVIILN